jgi:hypothetical protein
MESTIDCGFVHSRLNPVPASAPPIVVLTRAHGDAGWRLTVSEPGAPSLDALPVNARVSWTPGSGLQVHLGRAPSSIAVVSGGVLELERW